MNTIENLKISNETLEFNYYGTNDKGTLTNLGYIEAEYFIFSKPEKGTENDKFIRIFNGSLSEDNLSYYILVKPDEKSHYLIKTDSFNTNFQRI